MGAPPPRREIDGAPYGRSPVGYTFLKVIYRPELVGLLRPETVCWVRDCSLSVRNQFFLSSVHVRAAEPSFGYLCQGFVPKFLFSDWNLEEADRNNSSLEKGLVISELEGNTPSSAGPPNIGGPCVN